MSRMFIFVVSFLALATTPVLARQWTDSTGKYKQEAELVDVDEHLVILKKADGHLVAVPLDKLSEADREYVQSRAGKEVIQSQAAKDRSWALIDNTKISGRVVEYGQRDVTLSRKNGQLYVNDRPYNKLPMLHQLAIPMLVSLYENRTFKDAKSIEDLIVQRRTPLKYTVDGVMLELEDGEHFPLPFVLFTEKDRNILKPGWEAWLAAEKDRQAREGESAKVRALANEYQKNRDVEHKLKMLRLASEWYDVWEVMLMARNGATASVVVFANDSLTAETIALRMNPGAQLIGTRLMRPRY